MREKTKLLLHNYSLQTLKTNKQTLFSCTFVQAEMWLRRGGKSFDRGPIFRVAIFTGSPELYDAGNFGTVPTAKQAIWLLLIICHTRFGLMERLWGIFIVCSLLLSGKFCHRSMVLQCIHASSYQLAMLLKNFHIA